MAARYLYEAAGEYRMIRPKRIALVAADWPKPELYCTNFNGMRAGLERLEIPYLFASCRGPGDFELDIDAIVAYEPELVVYCMRDMVLRPDWRKEIRTRLPGVPIVLWYGDYRSDATGQIDADCSSTIDAMFISNDDQDRYYRVKWGMPAVHFLPLGCEPTPAPSYDKRFALDFIFIGGIVTGGPFYKRAHDISYLKAKGDLKIISSFETEMRTKIMRSMPEIYSSAKISLDVSHFTDVPGYTSNRFWIIPALWGFPLTKRWPGCEDFYPADSRIYFDTFDEALEKKAYYLAHEDERLATIEKSRQHVHRHTYDKRFSRMFELL